LTSNTFCTFIIYAIDCIFIALLLGMFFGMLGKVNREDGMGKRIMLCEDCILNGKNRPVPFRGKTTGIDILVIGDAPSAVDQKHLKMMTDMAGMRVFDALKKNGISPASVFFANACMCQMPKDIKSRASAAKKVLNCCRPAVELVIKTIKPKLIITFGALALTQVLKQSGITKKRGIFQFSDEWNTWVFPTFSPSAMDQDPGKAVFWDADMSQVGQFIRNGWKVPNLRERENSYQDVETLQPLLARKNFSVAIDTETQGNDWCDPNSVVISYSVTPEPGVGYNVWLVHEVDAGQEDFTITWPRKNGRQTEDTTVFVKRASNYEQKIADLRELCTRPDIKITMMNGNYDLHRIEQLGIPRKSVVGYTMDIQSAMHVMDPDNYKMASLKDIQTALMPGVSSHKTVQSTMDMGDMLAESRKDPAKVSRYACSDTDATFSCAKILGQKLLDEKRLLNYYVRLAHPVESQVLYEIEKNGIMMNRDRLPGLKDEVAQIMREKEREIEARLPSAIIDMHREKGLRLTRSAYIRDILFHKKGFRLKSLENTPTGQMKVGLPILKRLRDDLDDDHPAKEVLSLYLEWVPFKTLYGTFLKGFEAACKPDGRLHTRISKTFTATGRTGCIRKGSMVETVRDLNERPYGTPIEDVKIGDLVYSYDDRGLPAIRRVVDTAMTGVRELLRITFVNQKGKPRGYLDLTPEHRIRLSTGEYVEAQDAQPGMSVCSTRKTINCTGDHIIQSVEWLNEEDEVYDLEIEGTHNFVVGGVSVHNSRNPNLQNVPKRNPVIMQRIRSLLIAPPGKQLIAIDYSQSELRWIAHESQDPEFLRIFNAGEDAHTNTAKMMVHFQGRDWESLSKSEKKAMRQKAKPANFGLSYGQYPKGFQAFARDNYGVKLTLKECEEFRDLFLNKIYSGMPAWHERRKQECHQKGYIQSEFGFIRRLPAIHAQDQWKVNEAERLSVNSPIQSSSNDACLFSALDARRKGVYNDDERAKLVLFIHDELIFEVADDYVDEFIPKIIECMENVPTYENFGFRFSVPTVADAQIGTVMSEMRDL
jgi:uracil-DNA glycosylase family 4